jgi:hypothetical protein
VTWWQRCRAVVRRRWYRRERARLPLSAVRGCRSLATPASSGERARILSPQAHSWTHAPLHIRPLTSGQALRLASLYCAAETFLELCNQPATVYDP